MRWIPRNSPETNEANETSARELAERLAHARKLSPLIARLLAERGIADEDAGRRFLDPQLSDLHSPYLMNGMRAAVERLSAAIERHERVLIYGDYDVDGTMATVILKTAIEICGGNCEFHVPHRILEGYGMRDEVIERAGADGVRLIISVDTGIRAFAAAETAKKLGLDLIVTDHHLPQEHGVPDALAVLNPNQHGCEYPSKGLCGAGVAFKVAQALLEKYGRERLVPSFLKIVAIATIADAVPLVEENRVFTKLGLQELRRPVNPGLRALLEVCELTHGHAVTATEVAFRIAPRMNAAGRMDVAKDVIELFTVKDPARAREIAQHLDRLNGNRQQEEARITAAILQRVDAAPEMRDAFCMVLDGEGWHRGVIGICASRVVDRYGRPALVISRDGEEAHGSGRSIAAFHLLNALESCGELFTRYGGHAHAVGFALPSARIEELRERMNTFAKARLEEKDFERTLHYDAEVSLAEVNDTFFAGLQQLEPFGMGNPEPVFVARGVRSVAEARLLKEKHLKLRLQRSPDAGRQAPTMEALGWRMAEKCAQEPVSPGALLDIAFRVERNLHPEYGGALQLILSDYTVPASATGRS